LSGQVLGEEEAGFASAHDIEIAIAIDVRRY
jgi:hypothetical protein